MISLGLVIIVVVAIAFAVRRWTKGAPDGEALLLPDGRSGDVPVAQAEAPVDVKRSDRGPISLDEVLGRWVGASLLTVEQSAAIEQFERDRTAATVAAASAPVTARRVPAIAEALGYLGGVLVIVGLTLLVAHYWPSMATLWKLVLSGGVAAALGLVGWAVPEERDPALARLRGFVWLASMAAGGLFAGVTAYNGWGITRPQSIALSVAAVVATMGAAMWQGRVRPAQQLVTLAALLVVAGTATSEFASVGSVGIVVWLVGLAAIASAWWSRMTLAQMNIAVGGAAMLVGGMMMRSDWMAFGLIFSTATALIMLAAALTLSVHLERSRRVIIGIIGVVTFLNTVPQSIGFFAAKAGVMTGLVVWVFGAVLMVIATRHAIWSAGLVEVASGVALIGGAAICAVQSRGFSSIIGLLTALSLIALGTRPGQVMLSFLGSVGLLVFVPWSIVYYFPGPGRAPLLILISGALLLGLALMLSRQRGRVPKEFSALFGHRWSGHHGRMSH